MRTLPKLLAVLLLVGTVAAAAEDTAAPGHSDNPLRPFERIIGGKWHSDGSYSVFEWGVGRRSVRARQYFIVEGEPRLVGEGTWFWHPGEQAIRGIFTVVDMPVVLFDYTTRWDGDTMTSELVSYDEAGQPTKYVETWRFADEHRYAWHLRDAGTPDGEPVMGGAFERRPD